jgi:hypothetical protein
MERSIPFFEGHTALQLIEKAFQLIGPATLNGRVFGATLFQRVVQLFKQFALMLG